ncbi:MAG: PilZ domain-containing protein [Acidobacteriota bacterium]|nr:PilZ domain-containing protein [Acidobacteriota bacterium]
MTTNERTTRILTLVPKGEPINTLAPFLARSRMDITRAHSGAEALSLAGSIAFSLATASLPLPDMSVARLVTELRTLGDSGKPLPLILLATGHQLEAARIYESPPVQVVGPEEGEDALRRVIAEALGVATRLAVRVPVRLEVEIQKDLAFRFCETRDLSSSGMLISSRRPLAIGSSFDFELTLPHSQSLLAGCAEVVRHTELMYEETTGFGARFLEFRIGDSARVEAFIRSEQIHQR